MGLQINEELIVASEQNYKFKSITIAKNIAGNGMYAYIVFDILNETGQIVSDTTLSYTGEEFNSFWTDFNSGAYLYNQLIIKKNLQAAASDEQDAALELEFTNDEVPPNGIPSF